MPKRHILDRKDDSAQQAEPKRFKGEMSSFLAVLNADDKATAWTADSVLASLHNGAVFPTSKATGRVLRGFHSVAGFPENYAFSVYSHSANSPIGLQNFISKLRRGEKSQFDLRSFLATFEQREGYKANVFYIRCNDLTQNAQELWDLLQLQYRPGVDDEAESVASSLSLSPVAVSASAASVADAKEIAAVPTTEAAASPLKVDMSSFLEVLNAGDKATVWTADSVLASLHNGAAFPTSKTTGRVLREFRSVAGFPENYAFAIYSHAVTSPVRLRDFMSKLTTAKKSQFDLHYFLGAFKQQRAGYNANVFYIRCNNFTQNAQELWNQLQLQYNASVDGETESAASRASSQVSSPPVAAAAASASASSASAANNEENPAHAQVLTLTTAEIYARLHAAGARVIVTASHAAAAAALAIDSDALLFPGKLFQPPPTDLTQPPALPAPLRFGDGNELYSGAGFLGQEHGGGAGANSTLLSVGSASALPTSPAFAAAASPSRAHASLFALRGSPPVTTPAFDFNHSPKFGLGSTDS